MSIRGIRLVPIMRLNGLRTQNLASIPRTSDSLLLAVTRAGNKPLKLKLVRQQQVMEMVIAKHAWVQIETAKDAAGFKKLPVPEARRFALSSSTKTNNDPLHSLVDGKLVRSFGPVFANGVKDGAYKMDLGRVKTVKAINSWSCQMGRRGAQSVTLYGNASKKEPGWNLGEWTPIGSIDTRGNKGAIFNAASLRAADGEVLGKFRWIIWKVAPVGPAGGGEHTAFQELHLECATN